MVRVVPWTSPVPPVRPPSSTIRPETAPEYDCSGRACDKLMRPYPCSTLKRLLRVKPVPKYEPTSVAEPPTCMKSAEVTRIALTSDEEMFETLSALFPVFDAVPSG